MLQKLLKNVHDVEHLSLSRRLVVRQLLQDCTLAPLRERRNSVQQVRAHRGGELQASSVRLHNINAVDGIGHHVHIIVAQQPVHSVKDIPLSDHPRIHMKKLDATHHRCFPHISVDIGQPPSHRCLAVLENALQPQAAQRPQSQSPDGGIVISAILLQSIHRQNSKLSVLFSVVHQIQIDHLLLHQIRGVTCHDHVREEPGYIDTQCHVRNDLLDGIPLLLDVLVHGHTLEQLAQLIHLPLLVEVLPPGPGRPTGHGCRWG
mmetsp:Transcript_90012/g.241335  ORF Transcript_90012/g.241335 Transcript_90012/m.241335 type:complete len:261 (+) Transcript_90012:1119-1901(+)